MDQKRQVVLAEYFENYKKERFRYVLKNAVSSAGIVNTSNRKFFDNNCELMNKLTKDWQEVSRVSSPYIIRKEYLHLAIKFKRGKSKNKKNDFNCGWRML